MSRWMSILTPLFLITLSSVTAQAATTNVFGPGKYQAGAFRTATYSANFAGNARANSVIIIKNGSGTDLTPKVCSGTALNKFLCTLNNLALDVVMLLERPATVEISLNNRVIVSSANLSRRAAGIQLGVSLQAANNIQIKLGNLPTQNLTVTVRSDAVTNQAPLADFSFTPATATVGQAVVFNGLASRDTDGTVSTYFWDFGDGTTGSGGMVSHTYARSGTFPVKLTVTDNQGASGTKTLNLLVLGDTTAPVLTLTSPLPSAVFQNLTVLVAGSANEILSSVLANLDGESAVSLPLSVDKKSFSASLTSTRAGTRTVTVVAKDAVGNATTKTVAFQLNQVNRAPVADLKLTSAGQGNAPFMALFDASASVDPDGDALTFIFDFGDGVTVTGNKALISHEFVQPGNYSVRVTAKDPAGLSSQKTVSVVATQIVVPVPASQVAPPLAANVSGTFDDQIKFLYSGPNARQKNVQTNALKAQALAVLRGKVLDESGAALAGVEISILEQPQVGQTLTTSTGEFDIAINGGKALTVQYKKSGYFSLQRNVPVIPGENQNAPDVTLVRPDTKVTVISLATAGGKAMSSVVSDADGSRQSTVIFPEANAARLVMPDGTTRSVGQLSIRSTEYTVGPNGLQRMPASLPSQSGYTYAVEISADEAIALGADSVHFDKPVSHYVDNFLNLPVGTSVPHGYYNRTRGVWEAEPDGIVLKVLAIQNAQAVLDVRGQGQAASAADLAKLGISSTELGIIAQTYAAGKSLWRTQMMHLSPSDLNNVAAPKMNNNEAHTPGPQTDQSPPANNCSAGMNSNPNPNLKPGCVIEVSRQTMKEEVRLAGISESVFYNSDRAPGFSGGRRIVIPLTDSTISPDFKRVELTIDVAGQKIVKNFTPSPNLSDEFVWDGKDVYGRTINTKVQAKITIKAFFNDTYNLLSYFDLVNTGEPRTFGNITPPNVNVSVFPGRGEYSVNRFYSKSIGSTGALGPQDLGNWTFADHHFFDVKNQNLILGDGTTRSRDDLLPVIKGIAGFGTSTAEGVPAYSASLSDPRFMAEGPDGQIVFSDSQSRIRLIDTTGIVRTIAGGTTPGFSGDGGPALQARFNGIRGMWFAPDGRLIVVDGGNSRVRQIDRNGIVTTIAGTGALGVDGNDGSGGLAVNARLNLPGSPFVSKDGSIYFLDQDLNVLRKIDTLGFITTLSMPVGLTGGFAGENVPVSQARFYDAWLSAEGADGTLYVADSKNNAIRALHSNGIINTIAGVPGENGYDGQGTIATETHMDFPWNVTFDDSGTLHYVDSNNKYIRRIDSQGLVYSIAGDGTFDYRDAGQSGLKTSVPGGTSLLWSSLRQSFIFADFQTNEIREIIMPWQFDKLSQSYSIPSIDGSEVYIFDATGKHLRTLFGRSGQVKKTFQYDANNRLVSFADSFGNVTSIQRNGAGQATAVVGPYGHNTLISVNSQNQVVSFAGPEGRTTVVGYNSGGLMTSFRRPEGQETVYEYNAFGMLTKETDPAGGSQTLVEDSGKVIHTTPMQRVTQVVAASGGQFGGLKVIDSAGGVFSNNKYDTYLDTVTSDGNTSWISTAADTRLSNANEYVDQSYVQTPSGLYSYSWRDRSYAYNSDGSYQLTLQDGVDNSYNETVFNSVTGEYRRQSQLGQTSLTKVDALERPVLVQSGNFSPMAMSYDSKGRLASVTQGDRSTTYEYNTQGQLARLTDALGHITQFSYDSAGRPIAVQTPDNRITQTAYSKNDQVISLITPANILHELVQNAVDLLSLYKAPLGNRQAFGYNLDRDLISDTHADGKRVDYSYDAAGRISSATGSDGAQAGFIFDVAGRLTQVTGDSGVAISQGFDGSLLTARNYSGPVVASVTTSYYTPRQIASESVNGSSIDYFYDVDNRLTNADYLSLSRDVTSGLLSGLQLNAVSETRGLSAFGELSSSTVNFNASLLQKRVYLRDKLGRIAQVTETGVNGNLVSAYTYDLAGRLVEVRENGNLVASYSYDANGNRISASVRGNSFSGVYDSEDRLVSYGGKNYSYNAHGQLESIVNTLDSSSATLKYDSFGQLRSYRLPNGKLVEYLIDGEQHRVGVSVDGVRQRSFVYNGAGQLIAELLPSGALKSQFIYASQGHSPDAIILGGEKYYLLKDQLGSIRMVVQSITGAIVQKISYDEFGKVLSDTNPGYQPFGFAGGIYDSNTGLVRFGARSYDAETGRWTEKDPIRFSGGDANLYGYVASDPVNGIDPSGLYEVCTRPLNGFSEEHGPLFHQYLCANGSCGGQSPSGGMMSSPGRDSNDPAPGSTGVACEKGPEDNQKCMDQCIAGAIGGSRPNYSVVNLGGSNCQKWANDTVAKCSAQCGGK